MKMFAILVVKANAYKRPFFEESTVDAIRGFEMAVNKGESLLSSYPEDFALHEIGKFDQMSGVFTPLQLPLSIATGRSVLRNIPGVSHNGGLSPVTEARQ